MYPVGITNLFPSEGTQKCQHCQLCVFYIGGSKRGTRYVIPLHGLILFYNPVFWKAMTKSIGWRLRLGNSPLLWYNSTTDHIKNGDCGPQSCHPVHPGPLAHSLLLLLFVSGSRTARTGTRLILLRVQHTDVMLTQFPWYRGSTLPHTLLERNNTPSKHLSVKL